MASGTASISHFTSECPRCGHDRVQTGYGHDELAELLRSGGEIQAYCISCDKEWPITPDERADLHGALASSRSAPKTKGPRC